jgi:hypothetical protein
VRKLLEDLPIRTDPACLRRWLSWVEHKMNEGLSNYVSPGFLLPFHISLLFSFLKVQPVVGFGVRSFRPYRYSLARCEKSTLALCDLYSPCHLVFTGFKRQQTYTESPRTTATPVFQDLGTVSSPPWWTQVTDHLDPDLCSVLPWLLFGGTRMREYANRGYYQQENTDDLAQTLFEMDREAIIYHDSPAPGQSSNPRTTYAHPRNSSMV